MRRITIEEALAHVKAQGGRKLPSPKFDMSARRMTFCQASEDDCRFRWCPHGEHSRHCPLDLVKHDDEDDDHD